MIQSYKHVFLIILFFLLNVGILVAGTIGGFYLYDGYKEKQLLEQNISSAQAPAAYPITIDFDKQISTGSPLIFGGAHYPPLDQEDAWDKLAQAGVTSIRVDFFLEDQFPKNTTLEGYKDNENDIQNSAKWGGKVIREKKEIFEQAKKRGIRVIGVLDYAPRWLTYSGTQYGVPKDWDVYKDIVSKTYKIYRPYIDYLEIWNEPNLPNDKLFLVTTGTSLSKSQAYNRIFLNAATAVQAVDKEMNDGKKARIGAQVSYTADDPSFLEPLLKDPETAKLIHFVSYHQYEHNPSNSIKKYKDLTEKYDKPKLPIFITEWSYSSKGSEIGKIITEIPGIPYAGSMLVNYLRMGVAGANYHTVTALDYHKMYGIERNHAFYSWSNYKAELLPLAKSWQLLSKTLSLGAGSSKIMETTFKEGSILQSIGFTNVKGKKGIAIVNSADSTQFIEIKFENLPNNEQWKRAYVYEASEQRDGTKVINKELLEAKDNTMSLKLFLSPSSVTGVLLENDVSLPEQIRHKIIYH